MFLFFIQFLFSKRKIPKRKCKKIKIKKEGEWKKVPSINKYSNRNSKNILLDVGKDQTLQLISILTQ